MGLMRRTPPSTGVVVIVVLLSAGAIYFSSYYLGPGLLGYHSGVVSVLQALMPPAMVAAMLLWKWVSERRD